MIECLNQNSFLISSIKDIILALAAISTATVAIIGVSAWKKELKGKAEYKLAKELLKSVYKVREGFRQVRFPAVYADEYPNELTDYQGHLKKENDYEGTKFVYENRLKKLSAVFVKLEKKNLDAQVEWGDEYFDAIVQLRKCYSKLRSEIWLMLLNKKYPNEPTSFDRYILYEIEPIPENEHGSFSREINDAIGNFEKLLRPHINR